MRDLRAQRSENRSGDQLASGLPVRVARGEQLRMIVADARGAMSERVRGRRREMKRDMDLVREIMLKIEALPAGPARALSHGRGGGSRPAQPSRDAHRGRARAREDLPVAGLARRRDRHLDASRGRGTSGSTRCAIDACGTRRRRRCWRVAASLVVRAHQGSGDAHPADARRIARRLAGLPERDVDRSRAGRVDRCRRRVLAIDVGVDAGRRKRRTGVRSREIERPLHVDVELQRVRPAGSPSEPFPAIPMATFPERSTVPVSAS